MHILHYFVSLQKKVNTYTAPEIGEKPISANGGLLSLCNPITSLRGRLFLYRYVIVIQMEMFDYDTQFSQRRQDL